MNLSRQAAERILNYFDEITMAEKNFKSCQSSAYRSYVVSHCVAPRTTAAFEELRQGLTDEGENPPDGDGKT